MTPVTISRTDLARRTRKVLNQARRGQTIIFIYEYDFGSPIQGQLTGDKVSVTVQYRTLKQLQV